MESRGGKEFACGFLILKEIGTGLAGYRPAGFWVCGDTASHCNVNRRIIRPVKSKAADKELPLVDHLRRKVVVEQEKELFVVHHFLAPCGAIDGLKLVP